jgi:hypothetical protein
MITAVYGVRVRVQRLTKTAAVLVATGLSVPVFVVLSVIDWLWF